MVDFFLKEKKGKARYGWKASQEHPFQPSFSPIGRLWPDSEKSTIRFCCHRPVVDLATRRVGLAARRQNNNPNSKNGTKKSDITIYKTSLTVRGAFPSPTTIAPISLAIYWKTGLRPSLVPPFPVVRRRRLKRRKNWNCERRTSHKIYHFL